MSGRYYGLLTRYPEPGKVKSRLARELGQRGATDLYRRMVEHVLRQTAPEGSAYRRFVFYTPPEKAPAFSEWLPSERLLPQRGAELGAVMAHALADLFSEGAEKAVITGADIPLLDHSLLIRAFAALDRADVVIGPATDGGYYLIGMKNLHEELFRGIVWGTATVFAETMAAAAGCGLSVELTPVLQDLDTADDLRKVAQHLQLPERC